MFGSTRVEEWLFSKLVADPTVAASVSRQIGYAPAPEGWTFPFLVYQMVAPSDIGPIGGDVDAESLLYQIEMVDDRNSTARIATPAEAMHDALHFKVETLPSGHEISCYRERELVRTVSRDGDRTFRHLGGEYRVFVSAP